MAENLIDDFPLSTKRKVKGTRRLVREKALQIIIASEMSGVSWGTNFSHIFFRVFNFDTDENLPERLLKPDEIIELEADTPIIWKQEEIDFAQKLIRKSIENAALVEDLIAKNVTNWEIGRIAIIDKVLIRIAITELLNFEDVPPKVSINEAIDIAKKYSTEKSGHFINGVLDTLFAKLKKEGKVVKTGRGLIDL